MLIFYLLAANAKILWIVGLKFMDYRVESSWLQSVMFGFVLDNWVESHLKHFALESIPMRVWVRETILEVFLVFVFVFGLYKHPHVKVFLSLHIMNKFFRWATSDMNLDLYTLVTTFISISPSYFSFRLISSYAIWISHALFNGRALNKGPKMQTVDGGFMGVSCGHWRLTCQTTNAFDKHVLQGPSCTHHECKVHEPIYTLHSKMITCFWGINIKLLVKTKLTTR